LDRVGELIRRRTAKFIDGLVTHHFPYEVVELSFNEVVGDDSE